MDKRNESTEIRTENYHIFANIINIEAEKLSLSNIIKIAKKMMTRLIIIQYHLKLISIFKCMVNMHGKLNMVINVLSAKKG